MGMGMGSGAKFGNDAIKFRGILKLNYPVEQGIVLDYDDFIKVLKYAFKQLKANPKNHPVMMSKVALEPKANLEKITEIMFKEFGVPRFYI